MIVVLDTNVVVSGLITPHGPGGDIVRLVSNGDLALCYDARIIGEYREVLARPKFSISREDIVSFLDLIRATGTVVAASPLPVPLPDPDDDMFLEVALAGMADCLVTGNLRDYPVSRRKGMKILSPSEFMRFYRTEQPRQHP